ncbi:ATP-binding cassette subfamily B protein [Rhodovulum imhoffii]|uniref:ATP-binding cassette subfamily B protein n=1 Tax=Rhodovulum imhoffii TaxID=365340 RepID=A0A2T5BRI3_9RHOB|nr:ABC transporter ATP-binding protein [Rhodovulum imhoffii]PTN01895.1 ATP-binding cassette subfamily B protein [Rhodovulum imhoffii]
MKPAHLIDPFRPARGAPPRRLGRFMLWCLRGAWPAILLAAAISALSGTLEVLAALLLGVVIDTALEAGPQGFFATHWPLLPGLGVFFILLRPAVLGLSAFASSVVVQPNITPMVQARLNRWTLGQAVGFFDDDFAGRIAQKQMQTARAVTDVISEMVNVVAFALATLIGSAVLLTTIDLRIAAALSLWLMAYFALIRWFMPRIRRRSAARAGARAAVSGQIVDTITNVKTVKLFAHDRYEEDSVRAALGSYRDKAAGFGQVAALFRVSLLALAGVLPVVLIGGALILWSAGEASAGDIAAAGAVALRIAQMTGWVSFTLMAVYANIGEIENGMKTLAAPHALTDAPGARDLRMRDAKVAFDGVTFTYGRRGGGIQDLSLTVRPGEKLGIVGASGAGKSTLVSLLLRLYDPEEGRILIDGQDIAQVTQESLRRGIAMVTQETAMFNRSARENILYGRPGARDAEIIAAARKAEAHDFILGLRDGTGRTGYDAHLGERGVKLSGGQRQRIALARAFLKDAPILVLDEATSALDSELEASIQFALHRVMEGKTVLAIAHRLSTIAQMDRIVVLHEGRIAEQGTHAHLLSRAGLYARYWTRQSGGFIGLSEVEQ